jgi:adenosylcobinamide kinase / adenosylcobinamide-phosphate guanylyltransferase
MGARIIYITGGERSGKSSFAQQQALSLSDSPIYLATAHVWDDDFRARVERHKADRDEHWTTIEEEIQLSKHNFAGKVVLLDCITLWLTNIYSKNNFDCDLSFAFAKEEWQRLIKQEFTLIAVSNEIGMGGHAPSEAQRKFTSLQGWMNQHIAKQADNAYLMVSGLPLTLK